MQTINLTFGGILLIYMILLLPIFISWYLKLGIIRNIIISVCRMSVQLFLVGLYLKVVFDLNSFAVNMLWIFIMIIVANFSLLRNSKLPVKALFPWTLIGISAASFSIMAIFVWVVISPAPFYDARYTIPIFGMILGNCMNGNIISLERFFSGIKRNEKEFITYQMMGADLNEATLPYIKSALTAGISPQLASVATMGIVSLPGMMTGQMLGGAVPMTAIAYQIAIIICILSGMVTGSTINLLILRRTAFNKQGMLKKVFLK